MKLVINGENREVNAVSTLSALIDQLGIESDRVAVELNRELIPRDHWASTQIADGDELEIVHFVGGGCLPKNRKASLRST
jgi:thiamine biosynthesis protein ThiS